MRGVIHMFAVSFLFHKLACLTWEVMCAQKV